MREHEYTNLDIPEVPRLARTLREKLVKSAGFNYSAEAQMQYNRMMVFDARIARLIDEISAKRHEIYFLRMVCGVLVVLVLVGLSMVMRGGKG